MIQGLRTRCARAPPLATFCHRFAVQLQFHCSLLCHRFAVQSYCPFSATALKPVLLITSRSLASVNFWSSYFMTASPLSALTCASSTPSVAFSALVTDEEHFSHFIPL